MTGTGFRCRGRSRKCLKLLHAYFLRRTIRGFFPAIKLVTMAR
jgi:hypothetical protein